MLSNTDIQHIKDTFNKVYFLEYDNGDSLESIQVKAEKRTWEFDRWSKYPTTLSWKEAEQKLRSELTAEQNEGITISYDSEEYADLEEHDEEDECTTMKLTFK